MPQFSFHLYGFIVGIAVIICFELIKKNTQADDDKKTIEEGFLPVIVGSLIGGRLYHVFDQFDFYKTHPQNIFYLNQGGMGIFGAIIGGIVSALVFLIFTRRLSKVHQLAVNIFTVLPLGQAIGRLGNYVNKELFGTPTNLPWGISDKAGIIRHPLFFYEMILDLILFIFLYFRPQKSQNIGLYLCGYGAIRLFLEGYREQGDTWILSGISIAKLISLIMILSGLILYQKYTPKEN